MPNKREYMDFVTEWLSPLGDITTRSMFGGHVLYCDGVVFALVADHVFHLKVDDGTRAQFEALNLKPFQPFPDKPGTMQYFPPPPEFFEDPDTMKEWALAAIAAGKRAQAKKAPKKKKTGER
jgi:DNA transformation protein and related proteins